MTIELGSEAWEHELRAPDGRWLRAGGATLIGPGARASQGVLPSMPVPGTPHHDPDVERLARITDEQLAAGSRTTPSEGMQADTAIITLPGGRKVVRKKFSHEWTDINGISAEGFADREELASYVARALGAGTPVVQRRSPDTVLIDYVPGQTMGEYENAVMADEDDVAAADAMDGLATSDGGFKTGLIDYLISNTDRNGGNAMVTPAGRLVPIDHSSARFDAAEIYSPFTEANGIGQGPWDESEVAGWREELKKTQPEFIRLGHPDWYANMMTQLEGLTGNEMSRDRFRALLDGKPDTMPPVSQTFSIASQLGIELAGSQAWLHELRGPHGEWIKGPPHAYELPDPERLVSSRSPYKRPEDHPFFQRNPVSPKHIADAYDQSTDQEREQGTRWYPDGQLMATAIADGDTEKGAGVLSAYSPQTGWGPNMLNAAKSLARGKALGPGEGMITGAMQKRAQQMIDGGKIEDVFRKSPKTLAFARLLRHGKDPDGEKLGNVVIDRHAMSVAVGRRLTADDLDGAPIGDNRYYQYVADQFRQAAAAISKRDGKQVTPSELQAITWLHQQTANQEEDSTSRGRLGKGRETNVRKAWAAWQNWDWEHNLPGQIGTTSLPGGALAEEVRHSPDGFSVSMASGTSPKTGFMVAQNDATHTFPAEVMEDQKALAAAIDSYLMAESRVFNQPGMYLGGWVHDGKLWLEPSQNVTSKDEATRLAKARNQIAIWDVDNGQEIQTGGTGGGTVIEHGPGGTDTQGHFGSNPGELRPAAPEGAPADLAAARGPAAGGPALGIGAQLELAGGWRDAWLHEMRAPDGRWVHGAEGIASQVSSEISDEHILDKVRLWQTGTKDPQEKTHLAQAVAAMFGGDRHDAANYIRGAAEDADRQGLTARAYSMRQFANQIDKNTAASQAREDQVRDFTAKAAKVVPGLLGGRGKEAWTGRVSVFEDDEDPAVAGMLDWAGNMRVNATVARAIADAEAGEQVTDEASLMVPLHELIHGVIAPGAKYSDGMAEYQGQAGSEIEEGFTELGTIQHAADWLEQMGIGNLSAPDMDSAILGDFGEVTSDTAAEYARRVNTPDRIESGNAWGHYGLLTARAYHWVQAIADQEGYVMGSKQASARIQELSDEINREGTAGKIHVLAEQVARISVKPTPGAIDENDDRLFRHHGGFSTGHTPGLMTPNDWSDLESKIEEQWATDADTSEIVHTSRLQAMKAVRQARERVAAR